jgi:hypothetical protein
MPLIVTIEIAIAMAVAHASKKLRLVDVREWNDATFALHVLQVLSLRQVILSLSCCPHPLGASTTMSSMDSFASWSGRPVADLKSQLYTHLAHCRRQEPPDQVLQRFQTLFVEGEGEGYPDKAIWETLLELIYSPEAEREFKYTLNRCSYTLVNPWYTQPRDHWAIPALVELFDDIPARNGQISDAAYRIRRLSQQFTETDQFAALQRFADLVRPGGDEGVDFSEQPVARQLRRYPFLYDSQLLVTKDSDQAQREHARELRKQGEAQLGVKLARWARRQADKPFPNPTRLGR